MGMPSSVGPSKATVMITFIIGVIFTLLPTTANAKKECSTIENDLDRLSCYDREFGRSKEIKVDEKIGPWSVREDTSDFDDTTNIFLSVDAESTHACRFKDGKMSLTIRCMENTTSMIVNFGGCHMADSNGYGKVDWRLDDTKARSLSMVGSTNNKALGLWNGHDAIPEIKKMFGHEELLLRATPFGENAVTGKFNITGLEVVIGDLRKACNWGGKTALTEKTRKLQDQIFKALVEDGDQDAYKRLSCELKALQGEPCN